MPTPTPPRPARYVSIQTRLIALVLALVALALTITGVTAFALERSRVQQRVTAVLERDAAEFEALATQGSNPETGQPFDNARDLLRAALQYRVLAPNEGELGIVDQTVRWLAPEGVTVRPEDDADFLSAILPLTQADRTTIGTMATDAHRYRYLVVPVVFAATGERAALVRVFDLDVEYTTINRTYRTFALVALGALLLVGGVTWLAAGRLLQPVSWVRRTAEAIGSDDLSQRIPLRGRDDLTALTVTVNSMLDRLEAAVRDQRTLLDDVGHELRTPLTVVRGHLELMDAADPDDVVTTRALALDELDRMRLLVDDLLLLATAARPDFVRPVPTDIGRLTDETLEKARALGVRRWHLDALADVEAVVDPNRLTQAWLQLAANAVQYSAAGSTIGLGSSADGRELRLWVRDEGVGIALEDQEHVLERFVRASDRPPDAGGVGLGLAIVNSIARGHHGRVEIASAPGVGSTFTLVVPLTAPTTPGREP